MCGTERGRDSFAGNYFYQYGLIDDMSVSPAFEKISSSALLFLALFVVPFY
jgi:hypothetical protein